MPEHTPRPLCATLFHQESELTAVANSHRGKKALPQEMAISIRRVTEPTLDVLVFRLAEQKPTPNHTRKDGSQQRAVSEEARSWWEP